MILHQFLILYWENCILTNLIAEKYEPVDFSMSTIWTIKFNNNTATVIANDIAEVIDILNENGINCNYNDVIVLYQVSVTTNRIGIVVYK